MKLKQFLMDHRPTPAFVPVVVILMFMLALVGCAGNKPAVGAFDNTPIEILVKVPYECGQPPPVSRVSMRDIEWVIVEIDGEDFFTLTVDDYKALGLNTSDWIAASAEMKEQRNFYRECIARSQEDIHDENLDASLASDLPTE